MTREGKLRHEANKDGKGFTPIAPGEILPFNVENRGIVYVSMVERPDSELKLIFENKIEENT